MAPFLDPHLFWGIFDHLESQSSCYSKTDLLNAKIELVRQTKMIDMEMELHQALTQNAAIPGDLQSKKEAIDGT